MLFIAEFRVRSNVIVNNSVTRGEQAQLKQQAGAVQGALESCDLTALSPNNLKSFRCYEAAERQHVERTRSSAFMLRLRQPYSQEGCADGIPLSSCPTQISGLFSAGFWSRCSLEHHVKVMRLTSTKFLAFCKLPVRNRASTVSLNNRDHDKTFPCVVCRRQVAYGLRCGMSWAARDAGKTRQVHVDSTSVVYLTMGALSVTDDAVSQPNATVVISCTDNTGMFSQPAVTFSCISV